MNFLTSAEIGKWLSHRLPACKHLFIASPFVTGGPLKPIRQQLKKRDDFRFTLVTNLDVMAALMGALDIDALVKLLQKKKYRGQVNLLHDSRLHAKVFLVDQRAALVGSANLTRAGMGGRNLELATELTGEQQLQDLWRVVEPWTRRPKVTRASLEAVRERSEQLGREFKFKGLGAATSTALPLVARDGHDVAYFQNLCHFLEWVRTGRSGGRLVKKAEARLKTKKHKNLKTAQRDLHFIASLGLIRFKGATVKKIECTRDGTRVLAKSGRRFMFDLLWPRYAEIRWVGKLFTDLGSGSVTRDKLEAEAPGWINAPDIPTNWLRSLKLVRPHKSQKKGPIKMQMSPDKRRTWIRDALAKGGQG